MEIYSFSNIFYVLSEHYYYVHTNKAINGHMPGLLEFLEVSEETTGVCWLSDVLLMVLNQ